MSVHLPIIRTLEALDCRNVRLVQAQTRFQVFDLERHRLDVVEGFLVMIDNEAELLLRFFQELLQSQDTLALVFPVVLERDDGVSYPAEVEVEPQPREDPTGDGAT